MACLQLRFVMQVQAYTQEPISFLVIFCYVSFYSYRIQDRLGDCSATISWELGCTWPETLEEFGLAKDATHLYLFTISCETFRGANDESLEIQQSISFRSLL